ncbi:MAG: type II toxin-antitoxin system RelE/ParE family toxin [Bacilli bacterium]|jgi:mRNA interferase RelE/StbE|nr:type II toxin-antitoxin system RelE/ParE family toxin [Bacilli bacterium]
MAYKLSYSEDALKDLEKLDNSVRRMILHWLKKNIEETVNSRLHGKELVGNLRGYWRYRVGNYRIIMAIDDNEAVVLALRIGHRSTIYDI